MIIECLALLAERDRVVNALQELDFDFNLNKIPSEDYPVQRAALLQKGADILKKLDENHGNVSRTAEVLGLERSHLYRKMKTLGIAVKE